MNWHDPFNRCLEPEAKKASKRKWPMTERQALILRLYNAEFTTAEIAKLLGIAVDTLHKHMDRIYYKLDVHSRQEAIMKWLDMRSEK
jgi:DNA-binding NarL/FixJ family response regulator